jgi:hypothetical protein
MVRRGVDAVVPIPSFEGRAFVLANPAHAELTAWILVHANDFMAAFGKVAAGPVPARLGRPDNLPGFGCE